MTELTIGGPFQRIVKVNFVRRDNKVIVLPTGQWLEDLKIYPYATLGGSHMKASFDVVGNYKESFIEKYGIEHFNRYFKDLNVAVILECCNDEPAYDNEVLGLIFDRVVDQYYDEINSNWIQRHMRERTTEMLEILTREGDKILDLGCGPDSEVLGIKKRVEITELDVSQAALKKSKEIHQLDGNKIEWVLMKGDKKVPGNYDIIFSSYGYLNVEDPRNIAEFLDTNLREGGYFIGSFMNRYGLLDLLLSLLQNRRNYVRERVTGRLTVNDSRYNSLSYPRKPTCFNRLKGMKSRYMGGVCTIIPPYNYKRLVNLGSKIGFLPFLDKLVGRMPLLWAGSDYVLFAYQKVGPVRFA
ncbi:MAG: methyltransferase domain-containing protein [Thermoplasmatales archaeon]